MEYLQHQRHQGKGCLAKCQTLFLGGNGLRYLRFVLCCRMHYFCYNVSQFDEHCPIALAHVTAPKPRAVCFNLFASTSSFVSLVLPCLCEDARQKTKSRTREILFSLRSLRWNASGILAFDLLRLRRIWSIMLLLFR